MWHVYTRGVVHAQLQWGKLWEKDRLKDSCVDGGQY